MHISYKPLWHTLLERDMRKEDLRLAAGMTTNMIANMSKEGKHTDLSSVDADLAQIQNRLARLSDCERQYQAALSEKIKSIKASAHPAAHLVAESESRIAALKV